MPLISLGLSGASVGGVSLLQVVVGVVIGQKPQLAFVELNCGQRR